MPGALASVGRLFEAAGVPYALIGAHAVNAWIEPRITADIDVTAQISPADLARLERELAAERFTRTRAEGMDLPSGPDFVRFASGDGAIVLEIQAAKTELQRSVIQRAIRAEDGVRVATPEDLIVLKLIANRPKDQVDLLGLVELAGLDWPYVERWAAEWEVLDLLRRLRKR
jgi:hypothetical protein